jgi:pimeloyl-ACP methyl ester carboxylesterase
MLTSTTRVKVHFCSGDTQCAAWHYPGANGGCVIMAGGLGVTKEPATDPFAKRFNEAGFTVLAFDFRRLGESGGEPRQLVRIGEQQADWQAAVAFAATLGEVDPSRIAIWGFSLSGGHVLRVASLNAQVRAAIAHSALADGPAVAPNALRHQSPLATLRLIARGVADFFGGLLGREPLLVPLAAARGTVASISTPDALNGALALNPDNKYGAWRQEVAARSALRIGAYRPGRHASAIACPLLVLAYENDGVAPPGPSIRAGQRAPRGEVVCLPGGHYEGFLEGHERAVGVMLNFLRRQLLDDSQLTSAATPESRYRFSLGSAASESARTQNTGYPGATRSKSASAAF